MSNEPISKPDLLKQIAQRTYRDAVVQSRTVGTKAWTNYLARLKEMAAVPIINKDHRRKAKR